MNNYTVKKQGLTYGPLVLLGLLVEHPGQEPQFLKQLHAQHVRRHRSLNNFPAHEVHVAEQKPKAAILGVHAQLCKLVSQLVQVVAPHPRRESLESHPQALLVLAPSPLQGPNALDVSFDRHFDGGGAGLLHQVLGQQHFRLPQVLLVTEVLVESEDSSQVLRVPHLDCGSLAAEGGQESNFKPVHQHHEVEHVASLPNSRTHRCLHQAQRLQACE